MRNLIQDIQMNHPNVTLLRKSPTAVHHTLLLASEQNGLTLIREPQ